MTEPGIELHVYRAEDADELYQAACESTAEVSRWLPWCHRDYSRAEAEEWASTRAAAFEAGTAYDFVIRDRSGVFVGGCGLNAIYELHRIANLGYWVRTSRAGQGIASQAVRLLAEFAFCNTDLVRLEVVCAVGNTASQRVAQKAGAIREAVLRDRLLGPEGPEDAVMHAILRSTWKVG